MLSILPRSTLTLQYSLHQLLEYQQHYCSPTFTTLFILKQCGIFKFRGRRGDRKRRIQRYANLSFPFRSRPLSCRGVNLHNLTYAERRKDSAVAQESLFSPLVLCSVNVRSVKSKSPDLLDYIYTSGADLFAFTETWLTANDTAAKLEFIPPQTHKFLHHNRSGRKGGGTGLLFRENIDVSKIDEGERTSFEFLEWNLNTNSFRARLSIIYRPPYSNLHPVSLKTFFDDFASYMESIILTPEPLIISDFNIHVNNTNDSDACEFLDLLASLGLKQHVVGPTHEGGHTLALVITRQYDQVIKSAPMTDRFISDHAAVLCQLDSVKPCTAVKEISYRQLKSIDMDALRADLTTSELCTNLFTDLGMMVSTSLLDRYAPLRTKSVANKKRVEMALL